MELESGIHCMRPTVDDSGVCAEHLALVEEARVREEQAREEFRARLSKGPFISRNACGMPLFFSWSRPR